MIKLLAPISPLACGVQVIISATRGVKTISKLVKENKEKEPKKKEINVVDLDLY